MGMSVTTCVSKRVSADAVVVARVGTCLAANVIISTKNGIVMSSTGK